MSQQETFLVRVRKGIERQSPLGNPTFEQNYHKSLEQGRMLESSIGDASYTLTTYKKYMQDQINAYTSLNILATDGQFPDSIRPAKYVKDAMDFVKQIQKYNQELLGVIKAIQGQVGKLQSYKQNIQAMVQANSNALANLLNQICNMRLPTLPGIPNFFTDLYFDGFSFPKASFDFNLTFDKNWAFSACKNRSPNDPAYDMFRNYPKPFKVSGVPLLNPTTVAPLGGKYVDSSQLIDPLFIQNELNNTTVPYFSEDFNPTEDLNPSSQYGTLPNPEKIISKYALPRVIYEGNVLSFTDAPSVQNIWSSQFNYNQTACWVLYVYNTRGARQGNWLPEFEELFQTYVKPSWDQLETVPWNNLYQGSGVKWSPTALKLADEFRTHGEDRNGQLAYLLSFMEEALLGYPRTTNFDSYAIAPLGTDLDDLVARVTSNVILYSGDYHKFDTSKLYEEGRSKVQIVLDSDGLATYPPSIYVPDLLERVMRQVISLSKDSIKATPQYQSPHPQNRMYYDILSGAHSIDSYSQFWRDFVMSWEYLTTAEDPILAAFIMNYQDSLYQYLNPLAVDKTFLTTMVADVSTRDNSWIPGMPRLPTPVIPDYASLVVPNERGNGWNGDEFDPVGYLLRPDIQLLTPNEKLKMVQVQRSYAALKQYEFAVTSAIDAQITSLGAVSGSVIGVSAYRSLDYSNVPSGGALLSYDIEDFDSSSFHATGSEEFVIPTTSLYSIEVNTSWGASQDSGTRSQTVIRNGSQILDIQNNYAATPTDTRAALTILLNAGDIITVRIFHDLANPQPILKDTTKVTIMDVGQAGTGGGAIGGGGSGSGSAGSTTDPSIKNVPAAGALPSAGICVTLNSSGAATVANPTLDAIPWIDGITMGPVAGGTVDIGIMHGGLYTIPGASYSVGPLFLSATGSLTQTMPATVDGYLWLVVAGRAINSDTIIFDLQVPVRIG